MTNALAQPSRTVVGNDDLYRQLMQTFGLLTGADDWGAPVSLTSHSDAAVYAATIQNQHANGYHLNIPSVLQATASGVTLSAATITGALSANGNVTLGDAAGDTVTVNGTPTFLAASTFKQNVTIQNSALTTLAAFVVTAGAQTITLGAAATPGLYIDVASAKTLVGTATALSSAPSDLFHVVGNRSYFAPNGEVYAIGLRYSASTLGQVFLGASNSATPDLVASNNAGTQVFRALNAGGLIVGTATAMTGSEAFKVTSGGIHVTGTATFANGGSFGGNLQVNAALDVTGDVVLGNAAGDTITVNGTPTFQTGFTVNGAVNASSADLGSNVVVGTLTIDGSGSVALFNGTSQTQTTVGGAGGASALPATPRGYLKITVGASARLVPFYDA